MEYKELLKTFYFETWQKEILSQYWIKNSLFAIQQRTQNLFMLQTVEFFGLSDLFLFEQ